MKKYICSNCGFRSRFQIENIKHKSGATHHKCRKCGAVAFNASLVFESMMREYMIKNKLNFPM